jgi:hypothetical protein
VALIVSVPPNPEASAQLTNVRLPHVPEYNPMTTSVEMPEMQFTLNVVCAGVTLYQTSYPFVAVKPLQLNGGIVCVEPQRLPGV